MLSSAQPSAFGDDVLRVLSDHPHCGRSRATITALSQRLVKLEQRQEALELQLRQQQQNLNAVPDEEISTLEGVEALLRETRELLESTAPIPEPEMADESSQNHAWGQEDETEAGRDVA